MFFIQSSTLSKSNNQNIHLPILPTYFICNEILTFWRLHYRNKLLKLNDINHLKNLNGKKQMLYLWKIFTFSTSSFLLYQRVVFTLPTKSFTFSREKSFLIRNSLYFSLQKNTSSAPNSLLNALITALFYHFTQNRKCKKYYLFIRLLTAYTS